MVKFDNAEDMKNYLSHGLDLYCPETNEYVFLYNDNGAICCYDSITPEKTVELEQLIDEVDACCWSDILSLGGDIYDDPMKYIEGKWNQEWYGCGEWVELLAKK